VCSDRHLLNEETAGDLRGRELLRQELEHLEFAVGEIVPNRQPLSPFALVQALDQPPDERSRQRSLAREHPLERGRKWR
jgi:hypothetical protein